MLDDAPEHVLVSNEEHLLVFLNRLEGGPDLLVPVRHYALLNVLKALSVRQL